jgi:hypothetical protein
MNESVWCFTNRIDRKFRLTITDIERLRILRELIEKTERRLAALKKDPVNNADYILQERMILNTSKQDAHKLEQGILFFEIK